jgi:hypothetical protein
MGYCVEISLGNVRIPKDKVNDCLAAINAMHSDDNLQNNAGGGMSGRDSEAVPVNQRCWYAWVRNPGENGFNSLTEAFLAWRYHACTDDNGDVVVEFFEGSKWGDDEQLYTTIAPYVNNGGMITCHGEDGSNWRYIFENNQVREQQAELSWEDV